VRGSCRGRGCVHGRGFLRVYVRSSRTMGPAELFPGAGWGWQRFPVVRYFKFGKKSLFLGGTRLLNEVSPYLLLRGNLWLNVGARDLWLSFLMDGLAGMEAILFLSQRFLSAIIRLLGLVPVEKLDCTGQQKLQFITMVAYKAANEIIFKAVSNTNRLLELSLSARLRGNVCLKHPSDKQELACEQGVLGSRMGNLFCCIFLTLFLPLFRNHLEILGAVFVTSVKILLCAFSLPLQNCCHVKV